MDQLKLKIPGICDAHHLVRCRSSGERDTEETLSEETLDIECLPDKVMLGYVSYPVRAFVGAKVMVMLQQCVGGTFRGVGSVQEGMGQRSV